MGSLPSMQATSARRSNASVTLAAGALALLAFAGSAAASPTYRTVALSLTDGPMGPGAGAGVTFINSAFLPTLGPTGVARPAVLNANGDVAFAAAATNGVGIWRNTFGGASNVNMVRAGQTSPAPSTGIFTAGGYLGLTMNNSGGIGYSHVFSSTSTGYFYAPTPGGSQYIARNGGTFTAPNGTTIANLAPSFAMTQSTGGTLAIVTNLTGSGATVFTGPGVSNLGVALQRGQVTPANNAQLDFTNSTVSVNDAGAIAFTGDIQFATATPPLTSSQNRGIMVARPGTGIELLALNNTAASFLAAGETWGTAGALSPSINNAGQVAVANSSLGGTATAVNNSVIIRGDGPGQVAAVLREGAAIPGRTNVRFGGVNNSTSSLGSAVINARGTIFGVSTGNADLAGNARAAGDGNTAVYLIADDAANTVTTLALSGDTAPGTGGGRFLSFNANLRAINGRDQVAFLSTLIIDSASGVSTANDLALYATDLNGALHLIAREGAAFEVAPGDVRTVTNIIFSPSVGNGPTSGEDGRGVFFNDRGDIVFQLQFTDTQGNITSGVFVANIPAPGAAGLLAVASLLAGRRRR
jgi:hypothetical protein